jgi:hypothetical protein
MTAIIGILNKSGVALAADSAVTIGFSGERKIYNTANKIFNISTNAPIGIMIYNNAAFMGIPWETLIKMYRKELGDFTFEKVIDYRDHFLEFLNKIILNEVVTAQKDVTILEVIDNLTNLINEDLNEALQAKYDNTVNWEKLEEEEKKKEVNETLIFGIEKKIKYLIGKDDLKSLHEYSSDDFLLDYSDLIESRITDFLNEFLIIDRTEQLIKVFKDLVFHAIKKGRFYESCSGIVFSGFGNSELFPCIYSLTIGGVVSSKIRYRFDDNQAKIDNDTSSSINAFAQGDVVTTFMEGIDPFLSKSIPEIFETSLIKYKEEILKKIEVEKFKEVEEYFDSTIDNVIKSLNKSLNEIKKEKFIDPIVHTVDTLSKEDLAEMAESLINLTYLKRRVSFDEESVGIPVDVAIITKGDGFIWIKRKHYFKPELNLNYISGVLKK